MGWKVGGFSKIHNKAKMVNVARIPCKFTAVHAANNRWEMHIFMHSFICKKPNSFISKSHRQVCAKLDISIQNCIIRNVSVLTERYQIPLIILQMNNELLKFSPYWRRRRCIVTIACKLTLLPAAAARVKQQVALQLCLFNVQLTHGT